VLDITGNQLPVATDTASQVDEVVRVTDGANTLANLLSLPSETLLRLARCLHLLLGLLQTRCGLGGTAYAASVRLYVGTLEVRLYLPAHRFSRYDGLFGSTLFGGYRARDSLAQVMLPMEDVG
jgi:hypothetical protein